MYRFAHMRFAWALTLLMCAPFAWAATSELTPLRVVYPRPSPDADPNRDYYLQLLKLVLHKVPGAVDLRPHAQQMVAPRVLRMIQADEGMDIIWGPTTAALEDKLLPVRIPLDKGILGWRIFLVRQQDRALFANVHTLEQLGQYRAGLQQEWSDTAILRANHLEVVDAPTYESLARMLAVGRFQYFPRGVGEIWSEAETYANLGLVVEPNLALHYPTHTYFFVGRHNTRLAQRLAQGLRQAMRDGSFDRLFDKFNGEALKRAHLASRQVFELSNPLLPKAPAPAP